MLITESPVAAALTASLLAGAATGVGALPVLSMGRPNEQQQNIMLGFAAGVMLAASLFSLIIPGIEQARMAGAGRVEASVTVVAAMLIGAICLARLKLLVPSLDNVGLGLHGIGAERFRRVWFFVAAITLHNFPEGLAVGVSFAGRDMALGTTTALAIGLQNLPEGLAVAGILAGAGYSRSRSVIAALLSGMVEPVAGLFGILAVSIAVPLLPWGLGFAAGAMIYVVASEIIPDIHSRKIGNAKATIGLIVGLGAMMFLDTTLD